MDAAKQTDTECTDLYRMDVTLVGAGITPKVVVSGASDYTENYFNVPDYPDGITGIRGYEKVTLEGVYPGIDWVLYTENGEVKYDFIVHAGADPSLIRLEYSGAVALKILPEDGTLTAVTPMGEIREAAPVCFSGDSRVEAGFNLNSNILSFDLGAYDTTRDLVIDPALLWSTYFGGTDYDYAYATTTDFFGNVYLCGFAKSSGLATSGAHQTTLSGTLGDAFLAKYNSSGVRQWATYYGGTNLEIAYSVAVNDAGDVYLAGFTNSTASIASTGAYDVTYGGAGLRDAFLVKFNSSGTRQWGTYYGGSGNDEGYSLGLASDGSVFLAGTTSTTGDISTLNSYGGGTSDAFLVKFSSSGARIWSCYYGGAGGDEFNGMAVDRVTNDLYLTGATNSTTGLANGGSPFQSALSGGTDAFLAKFDANGTNLWGTYYGGTGDDCGFSTAVDKSGAIYMAGRTASNTGISTINARAGLEDGFVTKFASTGARSWGRYFGGPAKDEGYFVAVDGTNGVYVSGYTESSTGINSSGITGFSSYSGAGDAMAAKFDNAGTPVWSTYFGGTGADYGYGIAVDGKGDVYLAGQLASSFSMSGGDDLTYGGGGGDGFLAKIDESSCPIFTGAPANVTVTNSMCPSFTGGEITPPSASPSPCPYGSTIQYAVSTDGGTSYGSWSTTI
ncbi:MAG: SBBP repeat-containing protein, partial [Bacteroidota bacterium]